MYFTAMLPFKSICTMENAADPNRSKSTLEKMVKAIYCAWTYRTFQQGLLPPEENQQYQHLHQ